MRQYTTVTAVNHRHCSIPLPVQYTIATAVNHCHCSKPPPLQYTTATAVYHRHCSIPLALQYTMATTHSLQSHITFFSFKFDCIKLPALIVLLSVLSALCYCLHLLLSAVLAPATRLSARKSSSPPPPRISFFKIQHLNVHNVVQSGLRSSGRHGTPCTFVAV